MNSKVELKIDWCSYKAAKWAVEHWHYSKRMPKSKLAKLGVWENGDFVGVVIFGVGATNNIARPYGLKNTDVCELVRVALKEHITPVTKILSICLRILKKTYSLKLVVSYADSSQGHTGKIYQAGNWVYSGLIDSDIEIFHNGNWYHRRGAFDVLGSSSAKGRKIRKTGKKYKYLYPLDKKISEQIKRFSKPYPKRRAGSIDSDATGNQPGKGGAIPTSALKVNEAV